MAEERKEKSLAAGDVGKMDKQRKLLFEARTEPMHICCNKSYLIHFFLEILPQVSLDSAAAISANACWNVLWCSPIRNFIFGRRYVPILTKFLCLNGSLVGVEPQKGFENVILDSL